MTSTNSTLDCFGDSCIVPNSIEDKTYGTRWSNILNWLWGASSFWFIAWGY